MSIDIETNHLYKQINRKLNLTVSEHLNTSAGYIIYTNRKFIDPKEKRQSLNSLRRQIFSL